MPAHFDINAHTWVWKRLFFTHTGKMENSYIVIQKNFDGSNFRGVEIEFFKLSKLEPLRLREIRSRPADDFQLSTVLEVLTLRDQTLDCNSILPVLLYKHSVSCIRPYN